MGLHGPPLEDGDGPVPARQAPPWAQASGDDWSNSCKGYILADCLSMQAMRDRGIYEVLPHDHHFAQEDFTILPRLGCVDSQSTTIEDRTGRPQYLLETASRCRSWWGRES
jgi:hypothetical protein